MFYFSGEYGNVSSPHLLGRKAREVTEDACAKAARFIGPAEPINIIFTGSGIEPDNFAIKGAAHALKNKGHTC